MAQTTFGTFVGIVTDKSDAAIAGATITVANVDTALSRQTKTDPLGNYRVDSLLPGTYRMTAESAGFKAIQVSKAPCT